METCRDSRQLMRAGSSGRAAVKRWDWPRAADKGRKGTTGENNSVDRKSSALQLHVIETSRVVSRVDRRRLLPGKIAIPGPRVSAILEIASGTISTIKSSRYLIAREQLARRIQGFKTSKKVFYKRLRRDFKIRLDNRYLALRITSRPEIKFNSEFLC